MAGLRMGIRRFIRIRYLRGGIIYHIQRFILCIAVLIFAHRSNTGSRNLITSNHISKFILPYVDWPYQNSYRSVFTVFFDICHSCCRINQSIAVPVFIQMIDFGACLHFKLLIILTVFYPCKIAFCNL